MGEAKRRREAALTGEQHVTSSDHAYDDPNISAKDFLIAVMHDPTVPLRLRMTAADKVAPFMHPSLPQNRPAAFRIKIPELPDFSPELWADLFHALRCYRAGVLPFPTTDPETGLDFTKVKGHA
jgi:hypothetical protein